jgi:hypothetical protein
MTCPPQGTFNRMLIKSPLVWWRMGLGSVLERSMQVLTTWGRKTHTPRWTMLAYTMLEDGNVYVGAGWGFALPPLPGIPGD